MIVLCQQCGKEFKTSHKKRRFCSRNCANSYQTGKPNGHHPIFTKEWKEKLSASSKARIRKPHSDDTKRKIGESQKGKIISEYQKQRVSETHKGKTPWNKGLVGYLVGEKNPMWAGGKSFEEYSVDWTRSLRISIRERDHYVCQLCGEHQGDEAHSVHHIDYDKKNNNPDNLITLCRGCHTKTNYNREYWKNIFII